MDTERWRKIEHVFQSALERAPKGRHAFLDEACEGDPALRREVESLIEAHEQAGSFIEPSALEGGADSPGEDQPEAMSGQVVSHYRILSLLGSGGMGEVYLAQDTRLGRKVALKLLPAHFTKDEDRVRRFQKEARAASALNHPNIVTVFDIGQSDSIHFIATEFIEGQTLREAIHCGKVELNELLEYLAQVADGLAKAHTSGIIHRDLKPDNIMISRDGYAKVLDFGLAKLIEPQTLATGDTTEAATALIEHTQPGVVMGTAGYMSPEQAQGKAVDHRSDIFSFGCILYEAVTLHKPFEGDSLIDVLHKIVYAKPAAITEFRPRCPAELQRVIRKCLVKDPERRYQSIKDIAIDLREVLEERQSDPLFSGARPSAADLGRAREDAIHEVALSESSLSDTDPRVLQTTRFSKASIALAVLGVLGAIVIWPAYRQASVDSEFRLACTKVVAISKAREVVTGLGYDATKLEEKSFFDATELDLKRVVAAEGLAGAKMVVGDGKAAVWKIVLVPRARIERIQFGVIDMASLQSVPKPGEFSVWIDPRGRLVSFMTTPREDADAAALETEQAINTAETTVKRMLSVDPSGYDVEFIGKKSPPGVAEITWRNQTLVAGHREVVRANLQGSRVTRLSRSLEPLQDSNVSERDRKAVVRALAIVQGGIIILALLAAGALGVVFLIKGRRWNALRQRLPIAGSLTILGGLGGSFLLSELFDAGVWWLWFFMLLVVIIFAVVVAVASFFPFAGLFEWLRTVSPVRLYGAQQLLKGRILSKPVAASLVYGTLGGAAAAGIGTALSVLQSSVPGYSPTTSVTELVNFGSPAARGLSRIALWLVGVLMVAVIVELAQKLIRQRMLSIVIPALLIALASASEAWGGFRVLAVDLLSTFLVAVVTVHIYRSRGLAAAFLLVLTSGLLDLATRAYYVGESSFVLQSNLLLLFVVLLLAVGVWGYVRERAMRTLSALALKP